MKRTWFRQWGWLYRPDSWERVVVTALLVLFLAQVFWVVDGRSHSVSDTLYGIFPYWTPAILAWLWIGSKASPKGKEQ